MAKDMPTPKDLPTAKEVLDAFASDQSLQSKRDLTRHFGIKGAQRPGFKRLLRELEGEGMIQRKRKTLRRSGIIPSVAVLDISADCDPDELIGYPVKWAKEDGDKPPVHIDAERNARVIPAPGDRILARIEQRDGDMPTYVGKPMKILDKPRRAQIGVVRLDMDGARLLPVDRKQKEMRIASGDLGGAKDGDLVEIEIRTTGRMMIQRAKVTNIIGNPASEGAVSLIALHNLEIPYRFPASVQKAADTAEEVSTDGREDWRDMPFVTIDPADAKDHDDAVFAHKDESESNPDGHVVYVAIADVAAYVTSGSELDKEAFERGNSVYFPDRVVPMLPERISNELCSLKQGVNRPALAVRIVLAADGRKITHSFHRVTIKSAARLSYQQAQLAFDGRPDDVTEPLIDAVLVPLWHAYQALAHARDRRGPLALDLPERRIVLNEDGMVDRIQVPDRLEAHKLVEEMMISANVCAAEELERKNTPLIYRVHDAPGPEKLTALHEFLATLKLSLVKSEAVRPANFNQILKKVAKTPHTHQVSEMVLRTQARAEYAPENYGHFGLNLNHYAHFTSPIRRYADLVVHRALIFALGLGKDGQNANEAERLAGISQHISMTERRAMSAERETQDRLIAEFLSSQLGARFGGKISGVTRSGIFVKLNDSGADGFVPASSLGNDYYRHVEAQQAMIGERTGERFQLGDAVDVRLLEAAPMAGALRFEILSEGTQVAPVGRRTARDRKASRNRAAPPSRAGHKKRKQ